MKKKVWISFIASAITVSALIIGIHAYNSSKRQKYAENEFDTTEIQVAVVENANDNTNPAPTPNSLTWTEENGTCTTQKTVQIKNVDAEEENNPDAYIRVAIVPRWVTTPADSQSTIASTFEADVSAYQSTVTDGNTTSLVDYKPFGKLADISITNNTYTMGDVTFILADDWNTNWIFNPKDGYFYYKKKVAPNETTSVLLSSVSVPSSVIKFDTNVTLQIDILTDAVQTEGNAFYTLYPDCGITVDDKGELESS